MVIKFEINMTNKWLYSLIVVGVLLALGVGVWAYRTSNPSVMGHTSSEINFNIDYFYAPNVCEVNSWTTIPSSQGNTFCAVVAWDDDSLNRLNNEYECEVRRDSDGSWIYKIPVGCGDANCRIMCMKIS